MNFVLCILCDNDDVVIRQKKNWIIKRKCHKKYIDIE